MTNGNPGNLTKEEVYGKIEHKCSEVQADTKLRMRAQKDILKLLEEARVFLAEEDVVSESSLNKAVSKIALANFRHNQAKNQQMWLSIVICG
ncbi:MAG: hypothetical protein ACYSR0_07130 [Planctomycetota bacterium]|jgi:hypothetical protein